MRFSNSDLKKKIRNFQFFPEIGSKTPFPNQNVLKKFSSLHLFFLLFGFFLGNLSPQGFFFQSVPFLGPLLPRLESGTKTTDQILHPPHELREAQLSKWSRKEDFLKSSQMSQSSRDFPKQSFIKLDHQLKQLSEHNKSWSLIEIFNSFPGPAPTILLWNEIFNWFSFRFFSFERIGFPSGSFHFFLRSLNSIKIGFLLGIFVDAFKVGS